MMEKGVQGLMVQSGPSVENTEELLSLLVEDIPFNVKMFSDETQTLLLVTWLKLIIEDYYKARALFLDPSVGYRSGFLSGSGSRA